MNDISPDDVNRIIAYVEQDLSPGEMAETERWIARDDARRMQLEQLRRSRALAEHAPVPGLGDDFVAEVVAGVANRISPSGKSVDHPPASPNPRKRFGMRSDTLPRGRWVTGVLFGAAAVLAGVLFLPRDASGPQAHRFVTRYTTTTGQQATLVLPDGSSVRLAPHTTLTVAPGFGNAERTVSIVGEAVFEVRASAELPFRVQTQSSTTRVLGTTFAVRRYAEERVTHVAVMEGKVEVAAAERKHDPVILSAGMVGTITDSSVTSAAMGNTATYASWIHGRLVFQKAPVKEVLASMRRWYGYEFRVMDSVLAQQHLTVGISTESAQAALTALKAVWDVEFSYQGNVIVVRPARAAQQNPPARRDTYSTPKNEVGR